ncbi:insulinase family protein, partial [Rhizobium leguminosarum]|nr:insulinase family protein [Rhizobium leguminosarum]
IGKSSTLYQGLIEEKEYFNTIGAYTTETIDPGLLVVTGRVNEDIALEKAEEALHDIINKIQTNGFTEAELEKAKNHLEAALIYDTIDITQRAEELAYATLLGDTNMVNTNVDNLLSVTLEELQQVSKQLLQPENSSTLYYKRK